MCVPIAQGIAVMLIFFDSDICDRQLEHEYYYVYTRAKCRHVQTEAEGANNLLHN